MRCPKRWIAVACLALASTAEASAQVPTGGDGLAEATRALAIGTPLRISTELGATHYGSFAGWSEASLLYERDAQLVRLPSPEVLELSTGRRAWRKGALIGAIPGAIVGVLAGVLANGICDNGQREAGCGDDGLRYALIGGALSGGAGAAIGGTIGSAFHEWHPIYSSLDGPDR